MKIGVALGIVFWGSFLMALPPKAETENLLHQKMLGYFIEIANDPQLYISEHLHALKARNEANGTPHGGVKIPLQQKDLEVLALHSVWDKEPYCQRETNECVKESYKRILLIAIPILSCMRQFCDQSHLYFQMKGGVKTSCQWSNPETCVDSQIMYLPEEVEIKLK